MDRQAHHCTSIQKASNFVRRLMRRLVREMRRLTRYRAMVRTTFTSVVPHGKLHQYFFNQNYTVHAGQHDVYDVLAVHVLAHRFDLLGSGWVKVRHGMVCRGIEGHLYHSGPALQADTKGRWLQGRINRANLKESQRIWSLVESSYTPIDWQLDFKSGYRWSEKVWHLDIAYTKGPGVDIKVPWELARLQHLPWLGLMLYQSSKSGSTALVYMQEFRNQILDFISNNPPGFGVNWRCTMDVAIRAANMLLAYDIFRAGGTVFDYEFDDVFTRSIRDHGRHIVSNLEWHEQTRNNHYLANIAGLAFISAYLPRSAETDTWLAFSTQELVREVGHQFNADGTNFESSVCYHRLSAEMVLYATALLSNLPTEKNEALVSYDPKILKTKPKLDAAPVDVYPVPGGEHATPFPAWYWERLEKMGEFTLHLTKPKGLATQFGDNDSGRFFKLGIAIHEYAPDEVVSRDVNSAKCDPISSILYLDEADLDHRHLVAGINTFFKRNDLENFAPSDIGAGLVSELAGGIQVASYHGASHGSASNKVRVGSDENWNELLCRFSVLPQESRCTTEYSIDCLDLRYGLELFGYPDFGAYVFRTARLFLAVRCGKVGSGGLGGHAHLDQLTLELVIDGKSLVSDPGTYLYTPLPQRRNAYRSSHAHFVPHLPDREPGDLTRNIFLLDGRVDGECLYFGPRGFAGRHYGFGEAIYRLVAIEKNRIVVHDFSESGEVLDDSAPEKLPFSPGYGKQNCYQIA
jgi:hypothetical protein